jgi:hypothetical protein
MSQKDFQILAKKIGVGFIVYLIPLLILGGGLLLLQTFLKK